MTHISRSVFIDAPLSRVFAYASEWSRWEDWFEGVSGFRPLTEIEKGNGAKYAYRAKMMGISVPVDAEVRDFRKNKGWVATGKKGMPYTAKWTFREKGGGTEFTYALEYTLTIPLIGGFLDRKLMIPEWENILEKSLANLKATIEQANA